jgi:hypothetical protein
MPVDYKHEVEKILEYIKQERDEIYLQLSLGRKELEDEVGDIDEKLAGLRQRGDKVLEAAEESSEDLAAALKMLSEELRSTFAKVKQALKE